ncbi:Plectin [Phytophthora megakarya]|uniref:Plectin n=1 Tax=Phytophthora megakarya TaxID=4795 RepID=A0A225X064_9STRA|nr:Plectin [Phytophthora megakarya]
MKSNTGRKPPSNALFGDKRSPPVTTKLQRRTNHGDRAYTPAQPQIQPVGGTDLLLQLQQLQQQQSLAAFCYPTAGSAIPHNLPLCPNVYPSSSYMSSGQIMTTRTPGSTTREWGGPPSEKSGQVLEQLGSVLQQMKQESEGSAAAWREKLAETEQLTEQLAQTREQLNVVTNKERTTRESLQQVNEALKKLETEAAQNATQHRRELSVMNDEVQRLQQCTDEMREKHEAELLKARTELRDTCSRYEDQHKVQSEEFRGELTKFQQTYEEKVKKLEDQHATEREKVVEKLRELEQAKQELGQHLWNATEEIETASKRERQLQAQTKETQEELVRIQEAAAARERELQTQSDAQRNELHDELKKQLETATASANTERAQKEELNALMVTEMSRYQSELEKMDQQHAAALAERDKLAQEERVQALELREKTERVVREAQGELCDLRAELQTTKADKTRLEAKGSAENGTLQELNERLRETAGQLEDSNSQLQQLSNRCKTAERLTRQCLDLITQTPLGPCSSSDENEQDGYSSYGNEDPLAQLPSVVRAIKQLTKVSGMVEPLQLKVLRLQQERDSALENHKARELDFQTQVQNAQQEVESARQDAKTLAEELAKLSQAAGGQEAQLNRSNEQLRQQVQELEHLRSVSASQLLQVQKGLDAQRARSTALEAEKRDLLDEAEQLNSTLETQYRVVSDKQLELEQLRGSYRELQLSHGDLQETHSDLEESTRRTNERLATQLQNVQEETKTKLREIEKLRGELDRTTQTLSEERDTLARAREVEQAQRSHTEQELSSALEEKTHRLEEMLAMLTQLQNKVEHLEQMRTQDAEVSRQQHDTLSNQLSEAQQAKAHVENAYAAAVKAQQESKAQARLEVEQLRATLTPQFAELEAQKESQATELRRLDAELERASRTKQSLQLELQRAADDTQDALRAVEVARRDARAQSQQLGEEHEKLRQELEAMRIENQENVALSEELQIKITTIQSAANATIDDLVSELQAAQDTLELERARAKKDKDGGGTRSQLRELEEQLRARDTQLRETRDEATRTQEELEERLSELELRLQRTSNTLENKKQEYDAKSREMEALSRRTGEAERKLTPLVAARDSLQAKTHELKKALDMKTREAQDAEERARDEVLQVARERRGLDVQLTELRAENEVSHQQVARAQREVQALKQALERAKNDLSRSGAEQRSASQRLESVQQAANQTIADTTTRMQAVQQQSERTAARLQQELDLERERRREAEVHRAELQRALRQHQIQSPAAPIGSGSEDSDNNQARVNSADNSNPELTDRTTSTNSKSSRGVTEYRKFYANEPLTSSELSNLPMSVIKAQLGLEFSQGSNSATTTSKFSKSATKTKIQHQHKQRYAASKDSHTEDDGDAIPLLPLEKLPLSPEANSSPSSPTDGPSCSRSNSSQLLSSRSTPWSARSSSNSHLSFSRNNAASPATSFNNRNNSDGGIKKKKTKQSRSVGLPSASGMPYSVVATALSPAKPHKSKARGKILPRITTQ